MAYPFRIEKRSLITTQALGDQPSASAQDFADYMERLIKLIPAEILSVYLTVRGFWNPTDVGANIPNLDRSAPPDGGFLGWWPLMCIVLLWISRAWGTRANSDWRTLQIIPIFVATISFVVWVLAMGHQVLGWHCDPRLASTAVVVWVFLLPVLYNGSNNMPGRKSDESR
jgi:hypothetical protein